MHESRRWIRRTHWPLSSAWLCNTATFGGSTFFSSIFDGSAFFSFTFASRSTCHLIKTLKKGQHWFLKWNKQPLISVSATMGCDSCSMPSQSTSIKCGLVWYASKMLISWRPGRILWLPGLVTPTADRSGNRGLLAGGWSGYHCQTAERNESASLIKVPMIEVRQKGGRSGDSRSGATRSKSTACHALSHNLHGRHSS